jgi:hypothetical protein
MSRIALLTLCIGLFYAPLWAQEDTPTWQPQQDYIIGWTSEVIFPQAARFTVALGRPASELASAALVIQPSGQAAVEINVNVAESAVVTEPYAELVYVWEIPRGTPPQLFADIAFQWRVVSHQDQVAQIDDVLNFSDQRVEWVQDTDAPLAIHAPINGPDPSRLRRDLVIVYDLLVSNTGRTPEFNLILYGEDLPPSGCSENEDGELVAIGPVSGVAVNCDPTMAQAIFAASGYEVVDLGQSSSALEVVITKLVERFYQEEWAGKGVPEWFRVGLHQFYSPTSKSRLFPLLLSAARNNRLFTLNEMASLPASNQDVWLAQSYGMILYIADQTGVLGVYQLADEIGTADTFEGAYQSSVRQPLSALLVNWERWLFTAQAAAAFNLSPYQPNTPTATASVSRTPFPATSTATPTLTPTLTVTPTVTGVLSPTPFPTRTPVPTQTSAPPSVTPRPAGSLDTPTPTPPVQASALSEGVLRNAGMIALIGILVVTIGLLYRRWFK